MPVRETAASVPAEEGQPFQGARVVTMATAHAVHDTYQSFVAPLIPVFIQRLAMSKTEAGALDLFLRWPSVLQPVFGYIADRTSLRYIVILAPAITTTLMSFLGWSPSYLVLALLLLCVGLSSAAFHAVAPAMAGKLAGGKLGRGMSFWMVGGEMGRVLGPLVVVTWLRFASLQSMPLLAILGLLLSASLYILLRHVPETHTQRGQGLPIRQAWERMRPTMLPLVGLLIARAFISGAVPTFFAHLPDRKRVEPLVGRNLADRARGGGRRRRVSERHVQRLAGPPPHYPDLHDHPADLPLSLFGGGWLVALADLVAPRLYAALDHAGADGRGARELPREPLAGKFRVCLGQLYRARAGVGGGRGAGGSLWFAARLYRQRRTRAGRLAADFLAAREKVGQASCLFGLLSQVGEAGGQGCLPHEAQDSWNRTIYV